MRNAFFEFFTDDDTLLIQPAAEEVKYVVPTARDGTLTLGLSRRDDRRSTIKVVLSELGQAPLYITSLPNPHAPRPTSLNHFRNFYRVMGPVARIPFKEPFVRTWGRCDASDKFVHTMPGIKDFRLFDSKKQPPDPTDAVRRRTVDTCSCLAAQAFTPLEE